MSSKISAALTEELKTNSTPDIIITMQADTSSVLERLNATEFPTRNDRVNAVSSSLREHAEREQKPILDHLKSQYPTLEVNAMWISNEIYVKSAGQELINWLAGRDDVKQVRENAIIKLDDPIEGVEATSFSTN